jgi:uncharacterized protein
MISQPTLSGTAPEQDSPDSSRIFSLDVLRGLALLGMLIVSIWEFGGFTNNQKLHYILGQHGGNYKLFTAASVLFENKMQALLSLAIGAGLVLFFKKRRDSSLSNPDLYMRRQTVLLIFGVINAIVLLWPGDIIFHYAVMGILLFAFWRMSPRGLFIGAIFCTLIYCGKNFWNYADDKKAYKKYQVAAALDKKILKDSLDKKKADSLILNNIKDVTARKAMKDSLSKSVKKDTLTKIQRQDKQAWEGLVKGLKYDSTGDAGENKAMRSGYGAVWNNLLQRGKDRESTWLYKIGIWQIGSMMFLGMALLGLGFFADRFSTKKLLLIAVITLVCGFVFSWFRIEYYNHKVVDYTKYIEHYKIPYNQFLPLEIGLLATGYASLLMLLLRINILGWLWRTIALAGQSFFSNYFLQTILCTFCFYGYGFGYFGRLSQLELYFIVIEIWIVQIALTILWFRFYRRGPVEWLWCCLINGKWLPNKKVAVEKPLPAAGLISNP